MKTSREIFFILWTELLFSLNKGTVLSDCEKHWYHDYKHSTKESSMSCPLPLDFKLKLHKVSKHVLHILLSHKFIFLSYVTWSFPMLLLDFPSLFTVCIHVIVVVMGSVEYTNLIMQDIPHFCEGALQVPPCLLQDIILALTGPPGFLFPFILHWTQSPCGLCKDFSKDFTRLLPLKCLYLRGPRKRNMQFKPQKFM